MDHELPQLLTRKAGIFGHRHLEPREQLRQIGQREVREMFGHLACGRDAANAGEVEVLQRGLEVLVRHSLQVVHALVVPLGHVAFGEREASLEKENESKYNEWTV